MIASGTSLRRKLKIFQINIQNFYSFEKKIGRPRLSKEEAKNQVFEYRWRISRNAAKKTCRETIQERMNRWNGVRGSVGKMMEKIRLARFFLHPYVSPPFCDKFDTIKDMVEAERNSLVLKSVPSTWPPPSPLSNIPTRCRDYPYVRPTRTSRAPRIFLTPHTSIFKCG